MEQNEKISTFPSKPLRVGYMLVGLMAWQSRLTCPIMIQILGKWNREGFLHSFDMDKFTTEDEAARTILFSKYEEWSYEKEIRILNKSPWYELEKPVK